MNWGLLSVLAEVERYGLERQVRKSRWASRQAGKHTNKQANSPEGRDAKKQA